MASIEERKRVGGRTVYKAEVVTRIDGKRKKKSATFDRLTTAKAWAKKVEKELKRNGAEQVFEVRQDPKTVADAVDRYMSSTKIQIKSTKKQVLGFVRDRRCSFSDLKLKDIKAHDIRDFAEELSQGGRGPATVSSYLTHVCHVLSIAEDDLGEAYRVDLDALSRGKNSARRLGIAGKSRNRDVRPTHDYLDKLMTYFMRRAHDKRSVPMHFIVPFPPLTSLF